MIELERARASNPPVGNVSSLEVSTVLSASQAGASASSGRETPEQPVSKSRLAKIKVGFLSNILSFYI